MQLNDPELFEVAVQTVIEPGDQVTVTEDEAANPLPDAVALDPTTPLEAESVTCDETVKVAVLKLEGMALSAAVTVCVPWTAGGTRKEQEKPPPELVVAEHNATALGDHVTATEAVAANEVPVTVTLVPTGPLEVDREMLQPLLQVASGRAGAAPPDGALVVQYVAKAVFGGEARSVAVTEWGPTAPVGTTIGQTNEPSAAVDAVWPALQRIGLLSQAIWTGVEPANPPPMRSMIVPAGPLPGARVRLGVTRSEILGAPPEPASVVRSRTFSWCDPAVAAGTTNRQENPPLAVTVVHSDFDDVSQPTATFEFSQNPVPVRTT